MTLILQTFPASFGMPSASPFCAKVMCLLQMSGLDWRADDAADVRKAPKQKFPVLLDSGQVIPDSAAIEAHLINAHGCDFDAGLTPEQKARAHILTRMVEEHTYFALLSDRWLVDSHWEKLRTAYFNDLPFGIRSIVPPLVRRDVDRTCRGQGMSRHSRAEQAERVQHDLDAIASELGDQPYLTGDAPKSVDASVAPVLDSLANAHFTDGILQDLSIAPSLTAYIARCRDDLFPSDASYAWRNQ